MSPIFALFVASIAANKVQGFAVMKMSGVFSWAPMFAWFFPVPWQFVFGVIPHYWIAKVVWVMEARGNPWAYVAAALGFQFGLLLYLMRRFERVACRCIKNDGPMLHVTGRGRRDESGPPPY